MLKTKIIIIWLFVFLFSFLGCAQRIQVTPRPETFKLDSITEFSSANLISIENSQTSSEPVAFATYYEHEFLANFKEWTESAIAITQRELSLRGMKIGYNESKKLHLSVVNIRGTFGFAVIRVELILRVETGDGYVTEYIGDNRSPATLYRAADGAVMRAVVEMLRDQKIVEYLIR